MKKAKQEIKSPKKVVKGKSKVKALSKSKAKNAQGGIVGVAPITSNTATETPQQLGWPAGYGESTGGFGYVSYMDGCG